MQNNRVKLKLKRINSEKSKSAILYVFRSNKAIYAQIIDYKNGNIICQHSSNSIDSKLKPTEKAAQVGINIADSAKKKGITRVVFNRGNYKFHGRVKSLAEGARKSGLKF